MQARAPSLSRLKRVVAALIAAIIASIVFVLLGVFLPTERNYKAHPATAA